MIKCFLHQGRPQAGARGCYFTNKRFYGAIPGL